MKPTRFLRSTQIFPTHIRHGLPLICGASLALFAATASAVTIPRLDNTNTLDTVDAWSGGVVPTASDIAQWTSAVTGTGASATLAANVTFGELLMQNSTAINIAIGGGTLTLGSVGGVGIDMSAASANLTIATGLSLSSTGQWNVATGRNLAVTGVISGTAPVTTLNGLGTVTLNQIESFTSPTFTVNGGIFSLNQSALGTSAILPSTSILTLGGGTVLLTGNTGTITPAINTLNLASGSSVYQMTRGSGGRIAASSTNVTRTTGGTILFNGNDGSSTARFRLPLSANVNGVIPWATFSGNTSTGNGSGSALSDTWAVARNTSNDMVGYGITGFLYTASTATSLGTSTQNSNVGTDVSLASGGTVNTVRFNDTAARTVTITSGSLTLGAGGILVGNNLGANLSKITGGTLMGGAPGSGSGNDLIVIQNDTNTTGAFEIDSIIADNVTATPLTKSGPGVLVLGGANTFTGGIYLNQGTLRLTTGGSFNNNAVTFSNNSSASLALGGVNGTVASLTTSTVLAGTLPVVQNANITPAVLTVAPASAAKFAGNIQDGIGGGSFGLTKTGAGTLTLDGTNTYTGPTTVSNGTLVVKNTIATSSEINVTSPGILDVTNSGLTLASGNTLSGTGPVLGSVTANSGVNLTPGTLGTLATMTVGTLNLNSGANLNLDVQSGNTSDRIAVTGALTLGVGEVIGVNLAGAGAGISGSTFTVLTYGSLANFTPASFTITSGAVGGLTYTFADTGSAITLSITGTAAQSSTWALATGGSWTSPASNWTPAVVPNGSGQTAHFAGSIGGPATVALNGSKTVGGLTFESANVYTLTSGSGGSLIFNNGAAVANLIDSSVPGNPALPGQMIAAPVTLTSDTLVTVSSGETLALSSVISGGGTLTKAGAGTLNLATANSYAGVTTLNAGTLNFVNGALSNTDFTFVGGVLQYAAGNTEDISLTHLTTFAGTATIDTNGNDASFANDVGNSGAGGLTKAGLGKLSLGFSNSYNGATTVSAGVLNISGNGSLGFIPGSAAINLIVQNGATLQSGADGIFLDANRSVVLSSGTAVFDTQTNNMTIGGAISGSGILNKIGAGSLTLNGAGSYASTVVGEGTLAVGNNAALGGGTVTLNGTSTLNLGARSLANSVIVNGTNGLLSGDGGGVSGISTVSGAGTLNVTITSANVDLKSSLTGLSGTLGITSTGNFRFNGSTGSSATTFDFGASGSASVRLSSTTAVALGALQGGAGAVLTGSGGSGSTQAVTYTIGAKTVGVTPVNSSFAGTISNGAGAVSISKTGGSTLTLSGTNTYSGTTTVGGGTLLVNGSISGSTVTVNNTATLGGGTTVTPGVTGALTVNTGGTIAPGSGIGTINTGNAVISGTYACDISGAASDKLAVNGNLSISAATLAITGVPTSASYVIASYTGTLTGAGFANVSPALPAGYEVKIDTVNKQILVQFSNYSAWISSYFPGVTDPAIIGRTADPDHDGMNNLTEFALDGSPASGASSGKIAGKVATVAAAPTLVLTLPVRAGATFSAPGLPSNGELVSNVVNELIYKIQGGGSLSTWTLGVMEVTGPDKTAIETGLPALSDANWSYRTFQVPGTVSANPADFLRAGIITQP
ncbi:MAG: autotransporter-associated beta strand repeat-containing protein [Luteolibacter sp.]|uniref:beta strand repeat-containing protein n=1 Tax=Luteolibacter sp. TaxID=1962973 RepID=UPI003264EE9F